MTASAAAIRRDYEKAFADMLREKSGVDKGAMKIRRLFIAARVVYCVESNELQRLVEHDYDGYKVEVRGRRVALFWQNQDVQPASLVDGQT